MDSAIYGFTVMFIELSYHPDLLLKGFASIRIQHGHPDAVFAESVRKNLFPSKRRIEGRTVNMAIILYLRYRYTPEVSFETIPGSEKQSW